MTYTAEKLESQFKQLGGSRRGRKKYANDAGYWRGGKCNWGGSHTLKEDCQTLSNSFQKIESLREIKEELQKCTSKSEYDAKKSNYIRKCEESINGLQNKSASSSMFGVCCIWSDEGMDKHVISKLTNFQENLNKLKGDLEREDYKWVQEIKELNLEISQINQRMEENKRKAMKETDPIKKATLIQVIEEDGTLLQEKYKKKKEIDNKFNFDPKKKVDDLLKAMKDAIEKNSKKDKPTGTSKKNKNSTNSNASDSESDSNSDENTSNTNNSKNNQPKKEDNSDWYQENKQLILIAGATFLIIFYLYSQNQEIETLNQSNYDYY